MSAAFDRRETIREFCEIPEDKGIGRRAPSTPLDIFTLLAAGSLTTIARDGSTSLHPRVPPLRIDPPAYPSPTATRRAP